MTRYEVLSPNEKEWSEATPEPALKGLLDKYGRAMVADTRWRICPKDTELIDEMARVINSNISARDAAEAIYGILERRYLV